LLKLVLEKPGLNQQEIAERLQVNKSTVTRFIASVEKKGLLAREVVADKGKGRVVVPTEQAIAIQKELQSTRNK